MINPSRIRDFLDAYQAAFESFDPAAIGRFFAYPFQVTSDAGEVSVVSIPTPEAWLPQLQRLIGAYRQMGVSTAEVLGSSVEDLTPKLGQATIHWGLVKADATPIYDFTASYTLADLGEGTLITAIAHNETPRLRAYLQAHPAG